MWCLFYISLLFTLFLSCIFSICYHDLFRLLTPFIRLGGSAWQAWIFYHRKQPLPWCCLKKDFFKLNELRKGKFKASFLGRSVKAKFKVKNLHSSKENLSGFDFPALPSLTSVGTGDCVAGQAGKGGADRHRRRKVCGAGRSGAGWVAKILYGACAMLTLRFFGGDFIASVFSVLSSKQADNSVPLGRAVFAFHSPSSQERGNKK